MSMGKKKTTNINLLREGISMNYTWMCDICHDIAAMVGLYPLPIASIVNQNHTLLQLEEFR